MPRRPGTGGPVGGFVRLLRHTCTPSAVALGQFGQSQAVDLVVCDGLWAPWGSNPQPAESFSGLLSMVESGRLRLRG